MEIRCVLKLGAQNARTGMKSPFRSIIPRTSDESELVGPQNAFEQMFVYLIGERSH
jgi:hypothetical protein